MSNQEPLNLGIQYLSAEYEAGNLTPSQLITRVIASVDAYESVDAAVWILRIPDDELLARAVELESIPAEKRGPLYGIPFAVKDNIDVAGKPSTMACPQAAFTPAETAYAVQRLLDAGAILVGKTNLDQFATGLVGVRSPHGAPRSVFNKDYVSGGSSSGSGVAVAADLVSFSLGTDTAGSGRVPAGFNNIVGIKPTRGLLSTRGVFPANRTLDCVSVFAGSVPEANLVRQVAQGFDPKDDFSRRMKAVLLPASRLRVGVPHEDQLMFFGDDAAKAIFADAINKAEKLGWEIVRFDYEPFSQTAKLLYGSAWVAERLAAVKPFIDKTWHPVIRTIIGGAGDYDAAEAFEAIYKVEGLRSRCAEISEAFDIILVPTTPTTYTVEQIENDPIQLNANLGTYTNFVNLLDMAAVAVPAGFRTNGLPFGVTIVGPACSDEALSGLAHTLHKTLCPESGKARRPLRAEAAQAPDDGLIHIAVVGAHLSGMPLNSQLSDRGAKLMETTKTAADYRFYALKGTVPLKPGLLRETGFAGPGIEVEVWSMPSENFGSFVDLVPGPLGIGTVTLADGREVNGFICEPYGLDGAEDITALGGWRMFMKTKA